MAGFFYPSGIYAPGRSISPNMDPNLPYLIETKITPEGHYTIEAWPLEHRGRVSFAFFHKGLFQPPLTLLEEEFDSADAARAWWSRNAYTFPAHRFQAQLAQRYCTPILKREKAIKTALAEVGWAQARAIRRVRKGERYLVYFEQAVGPCEHWFIPHVHSCQLTVLDPQDRKIIKELYDCDNVGKGVQHYLDTLSDFDDARMEMIL